MLMLDNETLTRRSPIRSRCFAFIKICRVSVIVGQGLELSVLVGRKNNYEFFLQF